MIAEVETKEYPILFTGPMVRAILDGTKTQTRRVIKPQPFELDGRWYPGYGPGHAREWSWISEANMRKHMPASYCPYCPIGTVLWVRETWRWHSETKPIIEYRADGAKVHYENDPPQSGYGCGDAWRPNTHMKRKHCRLLLEITDVRVQRVQEISEEDAVAEGISMPIPDHPHRPGMGATHPSAVFSDLWDSINAKRGYGWDTNPWVWCISFKRIDAPSP